MIAFYSDLDNTLIFSRRREIRGDKVCVEHYQGKELSFMPAASAAMLKRLVTEAPLVFVPTTTRTQEQYERIDLGIRTPKYALVCNGGILLRDGILDEDWYQASLALTASARESLDMGAKLLEQDNDRDFEVRDIERLFVFTKSKAPDKTAAKLAQQLDLEQVEILTKRSKVYVVPKVLDKGSAVVRLNERLKAERTISAGDSDFDVPMLAAADLGLCPAGLLPVLPGNVKALAEDEFVYRLLNYVENDMAGSVS